MNLLGINKHTHASTVDTVGKDLPSIYHQKCIYHQTLKGTSFSVKVDNVKKKNDEIEWQC